MKDAIRSTFAASYSETGNTTDAVRKTAAVHNVSFRAVHDAVQDNAPRVFTVELNETCTEVEVKPTKRTLA